MKDTIPDSVTKDTFNSMCKKLIVEGRDTCFILIHPECLSKRSPQTSKKGIVCG
jgi:hypothetical protein